MPSTTRETNPRGQGRRLREEILRAATRLLAHSSRDAITLRAIAREAGIAAPSIYPHFADRDAILDAVVSEAFERMRARGVAAAADAGTGADRVRALCHAYTEYAREQPGEYRLLFDRSPANINSAAPFYEPGRLTFELLVDAVAAAAADGTGTSTDPALDAQALWATLHGLVTLVPGMPGFPWEPLDALVGQAVTALARLRA